MFKRVNSNKNGVIEYSIDSVEDLDILPRKETDNTVYATLNKNGKRLIYLYSKAEKDYILINGDLEEINKEINSISEELNNKVSEDDFNIYNNYYNSRRKVVIPNEFNFSKQIDIRKIAPLTYEVLKKPIDYFPLLTNK